MCTTACLQWWSRLLGATAPDKPAALSRRAFLGAAAVPLVATGCATATASPTSIAFLDSTVSVDLHAHPSLVPSLASATMDGHRRQAEAGHVKVISLTAVADGPVLGRTRTGGVRATREPATGELVKSTWEQLEVLTSRSQSVGIALVRTHAELAGPAAVPVRGLLAVEGCDFLEGRLDRVQQAFDRGVRSLQLVHYRVNELGDIQTEAPRHGGLTPFGRQVVRELNRLGIVVDVAHATFETVKGVAETSTRPIILSHSNIQDASGWARFISMEHARLVAGTGGVIGAMPILFGSRGDNINAYVNHISRLIEAVGVDHVGIGTDMDGIGPGTIFSNYARWPSLAAALLERGYGRDDVAKLLGGNFQRVYARVSATPAS